LSQVEITQTQVKKIDKKKNNEEMSSNVMIMSNRKSLRMLKANLQKIMCNYE